MDAFLIIFVTIALLFYSLYLYCWMADLSDRLDITRRLIQSVYLGVEDIRNQIECLKKGTEEEIKDE